MPRATDVASSIHATRPAERAAYQSRRPCTINESAAAGAGVGLPEAPRVRARPAGPGPPAEGRERRRGRGDSDRAVVVVAARRGVGLVAVVGGQHADRHEEGDGTRAGRKGPGAVAAAVWTGCRHERDRITSAWERA